MRSMVFAFAGPSGSGKTSLVQALQQYFLDRGEYWEVRTLSSRYSPYRMPWDAVAQLTREEFLNRQKILARWVVERMVELEAEYLYRPKKVLQDRAGVWETILYTRFYFPELEDEFLDIWKTWSIDWLRRNVSGLILLHNLDLDTEDPYRPPVEDNRQMMEYYLSWTNELGIPTLDLPKESLEARLEKVVHFIDSFRR